MVTTNEIEGTKIYDYLEIATGVIVRQPTIGQGLRGSWNISGGKNNAYTEACEETRNEAFDEMVEHAIRKGANAIIGMRYDASEFSDGVTEVIAYGTAVNVGSA